MKTGLILSIMLFCLILSSSAQFVNFGQDRASLRWRQIQTTDFQLIYPDYFESNAQKIANIYAQLYRYTNSLGHKPKKISVILHANGGVSNGNVAWAPKKSELYTMPPQDPQDSWLQHLCVHEFRHVVQLDKVNQGLTKGFYYLFGEIFPIAVVGLYVPMWFLEGDAVCYETSIGEIGRGRSPEFLNEMKAQVVEQGIYSYDKAVLGSYKTYVPNRYNMGYFMTANARLHYGKEIWAKALQRTGRRPFGITPFAKSLQLTLKGRRDSLWQDSTFRSLFVDPDSVYTANTFRDAKRTLYRDNFSELQQRWMREIKTYTSTFDTLPTFNKYYTNYHYPRPLTGEGWIAYKKGMEETGAFVRNNRGKEKLLTRTGSVDDPKFAFQREQIVWSEYYPNLRWEQGGRMVLSHYDLRTRKYKRHKTPWNRFAPFPAGEYWGCVEVNDQNQASLLLLDSTLKQEVWRLTGKAGELFIHPAYQKGKIATVVQDPEGLHLEIIEVANTTRQRITPVTHYEIDNPVFTSTGLLYRAAYNGNNAFYHLDLSADTSAHLLNAPFGVRYPFEYKDSVYFSFYTSQGYQPGRINRQQLQASPIEEKIFRLADTLKQQEGWTLQPASDSIYPSRKYHKFTHLVNIHSWGPLYVDLNHEDVDIGAVVYSQNKLSTLSFTAGYVLRSGYDHGAWIFQASYQGWWPIIDVDFKSGKEDYYSFDKALDLTADSVSSLYLYNKAYRTTAELTARLPFNLSKRQYSRYIQPYIRYKTEVLHRIRPSRIYSYETQGNTIYITPRKKEDFQVSIPANYYQLMEYGLTLSNQTRMTVRELNPRWGQMISGGFTQSLKKKMDIGSQWWVDGRLYLPAFFPNHSLSLYGGFQRMSEKQRHYSNKIFSPRGISLYGYELSSFRGTYRLPLLCPDLSLTSVVYLKRIQGALFYDWGMEHQLHNKNSYFSSGIELTGDTHFFRLPYPVQIGLRTGYESAHRKLFVDLLFSIGFSL